MAITAEADSGAYAKFSTVAGSDNLVIQLQMPTKHGDGTPVKKLLADALAQASKEHKGVLVSYYSTIYHVYSDIYNDNDVQAILEKYFVILNIDAWERHDSWANKGFRHLRDPKTKAILGFNNISIIDVKGALHSINAQDIFSGDRLKFGQSVTNAIRKIEPRITDAQAQTLAKTIKSPIE